MSGEKGNGAQGRDRDTRDNSVTSFLVRVPIDTLAHLLNFRRRPHRAESVFDHQAA
jgi:hypothetical protein